MIKIPIQTLDDFHLVESHLKRIGFTGIEIMFMPHMDNFGFMLLRNKQYIAGNLDRAVHNQDEDLPVTPQRFLKLTEVQVNCILDTENFIDD